MEKRETLLRLYSRNPVLGVGAAGPRAALGGDGAARRRYSCPILWV
jgi:hypothetical protein